MCNSLMHFSTFNPGECRIWVAIRECIVSKGRGKVKKEELMLNDTLFVSQLQYNIVSISKLTKDLNCKLTLTFVCYLFQDRSLEKMIDNADERCGLYYSKSLSKSRCLLSNKSLDKDSCCISTYGILISFI